MTMKKSIRALCAIVLLVLLCAGLSACGGGPPQFDLPPGATVLRLAEADDVPSLDPAVGYDTMSWMFEQMLFNTLVRYGDANIELEPDLAQSWEISADARTFTFHLRDDARFTSGRAVGSADFKYSIERVLRPSTRSKGMEFFRGIEGAGEFVDGKSAGVRGIETPDPRTIIFRLTAPDPLFIHKLSMPFAAAIPREIAEKWGEDFSQHPVGSGPFKLLQWIGGQRIVLVRNPSYHVAGVPRLDAVDMLLGVNGELEWLKFEAGEIDVATIPPAEFPYVMKTPALRALTLHKTDIRVQYLGMNCEMWPFTDVRVRRAFNYAINREKLVKLLNGRGVAARGILPPNLPGSDPAIKGYAYDPDKARRLLEDARVPRGYAPELWLRADQTALTLGQSIQQDLALVGINVALKPLAWGPLLEAIRQPRTVQLFQMGWEADFPDPDNFLNVLLTRRQWGANNDTFYYDPRVDALVDEAAPMADLTRRYELYREAERIVMDDAPWVPLYNPVSYVIRQPWVRDYELNPLRPTRLERVRLAERTGHAPPR